MPKATTPAQYILILIDLVEGMGYGREKLLAGTSLARTGISGIGARVSEKDFTQLVANAFALTGDPALGLKLGLRLNLSAHAVLGQAFMTCANLGQVMTLFLKYYHLLSPGLHLELEVKRGRCILTTVSAPLDNPTEFTYELIYGGMLYTSQALLNLPRVELRVEAPYPAPTYADMYYEAFGEDVHFNCSRGRVSFDCALLDIPLPSSNPALRALYEEECYRLLADLKEEASITEQTLRLLRKLEGQYPQMPVIAQMLNFSPRTFRRRLEEEQQSFQALLGRVRAEHATHYLRNTQLPLASIANLIGFNDVSNFRRAYTHWAGQSPSEVRCTRRIPKRLQDDNHRA